MTPAVPNGILAPIMDLHHLRIFLSVFRHRSFSRASQQLRLAQPTVSDHIRTLEEYLDCRLFDRTGRKIIPTREAELLHDYAVEITEKAESMRHAIGRLKKEVAGHLLIGASSIPGTYLLPDLVAFFMRKFPSVSFQIQVSDSRLVVEKLINHELLLGIVGSRLNNAVIQYEPFCEDELILISSPLLCTKTSVRLREILDYPFICREEGSGTRRETERILAQHGLSRDSLRQAAVFGSTDAVKQAVKAELGVAIVSKFSVQDELRHRTLRKISVSDADMKRSFYLATHKKRSLPRIYQLFLEHLRSQAAHES